MASPKRFIQSQGDLDSACFLYSLVNAVQCLSGKKVAGSSWRRMISSIYNPMDFLTYQTGTSKVDTHPHLIVELASEYIATLNPKGKYEVSLQEGLDKNSKFGSLLNKKSLLIVDDGEHWFCLLDSHEGRFYKSCSAAWQENPRTYEETLSPRLARTCNASFPASDLKIFHALLITAK